MPRPRLSSRTAIVISGVSAFTKPKPCASSEKKRYQAAPIGSPATPSATSPTSLPRTTSLTRRARPLPLPGEWRTAQPYLRLRSLATVRRPAAQPSGTRSIRRPRTAATSNATSSSASAWFRARKTSAARRRRRSFSCPTASQGSPNLGPLLIFTSQKAAMLFGPIAVPHDWRSGRVADRCVGFCRPPG
jgi:hypothetical protein